jgi:hypothetical protein
VNVQYHAFISYSHAADGLLAPRLQSALQSFARPWNRRRALEIFRDETGLTANPGLWSSIAAALDNAEWFVLLASPESAQSPWVNREIEHWCQRRDPARILAVVTGGEWVWDVDAQDFDWQRSTAVPPALAQVFHEEPRHVDMRWARQDSQLDLRDGRFADQVADIAAPLHGVAKDDIAGADVRQHRRTRRVITATLVVLSLLVLTTAGTAIAALRQRSAAQENAVQADARRLAALALLERRADLSLLLAVQALRTDDNEDTRAGLLSVVQRVEPLTGTHDLGDSRLQEIAVSPDNQTVAVRDGDEVTVLNSDTGETRTIAASGDGLAFSPDGRRLAVGSSGQSGPAVHIHDMNEPSAAPQTIDLPYIDPYLAFLQEGAALVIAGHVPNGQGWRAETYDVSSGARGATLVEAGGDAPTAVTRLNNGEIVIAAGTESIVVDAAGATVTGRLFATRDPRRPGRGSRQP